MNLVNVWENTPFSDIFRHTKKNDGFLHLLVRMEHPLSVMWWFGGQAPDCPRKTNLLNLHEGLDIKLALLCISYTQAVDSGRMPLYFSTETPPNFNTGTSFLRHIQRENHQTRDPLFGFPSLWQSPASRAAPSAPASPQLLLAQIYNREMEAPKLAS